MNIFRILLWPFRRHAEVPANRAQAKPAAAPESEIHSAIIRHNDVEIAFATPNYATRWRVDTFFTKEPDTIEWIAGFKPDEVLIDIGANVGMYTIWAAMTRAARVYAFEPESQNYAILYQNIVRNKLSKRVVGYCAALSDETRFSLLYLSEFVTGGSIHTFGEELDFKLQPRPSAIAQGCIATTLDHLVGAGIVPVPDHIKIDVDGLEHKVLAGCRSVLADPKVKSVLIEINTNLKEHRALILDMGKLGFSYSQDQVKRSVRTEGAFAGVANHVFRR